MTAQPWIGENHRIPLDTAIRNSTPGQSDNVTRLYKACLDLFLGTNTVTGNGLLKSRHVSELKDGQFVLAVVTDDATGLFVQLGGNIKRDGATTMLLTYGKKFLMEMQPPQLQNTAIKLWN